MDVPSESSGLSQSELKYKNRGGRNSLTSIRQNRDLDTIELRKAKRSEQLIKRRNLQSNEHSDTELIGEESNVLIEHYDPAQMSEWVSELSNVDYAHRLAATKSIRKMLSNNHHPPIDYVISAGAVPSLISNLNCNENEVELQLESAWALTNICSGTSTQTQSVVDNGAVGVLIGLMHSQWEVLADQCAWAIGNMAGDSIELRNLVIINGCIPAVCALLQRATRLQTQQDCAWLFANLYRGGRQNAQCYDQVLSTLPYLSTILQQGAVNGQRVTVNADNSNNCNSNNTAVLDVVLCSDLVWCLAHAAKDNQSLVLGTGCAHWLVNCLKTTDVHSIAAGCARCLGNIVTGTHAETQAVLDAGILPVITQMLINANDVIQKVIQCQPECTWILSNILAGTESQIQSVVDTPSCLQALVHVLTLADYKCRKEVITGEGVLALISIVQAKLLPPVTLTCESEDRCRAAWAVANLFSGGNDSQKRSVVDSGCIKAVCDLLTVADNALVILTLTTVEAALKCYSNTQSLKERYKELLVEIEECGGLDKIEFLQQHENMEIYLTAKHVIDEYFSADDESHYDYGLFGTTDSVNNNALITSHEINIGNSID